VAIYRDISEVSVSEPRIAMIKTVLEELLQLVELEYDPVGRTRVRWESSEGKRLSPT